MNFADVMSREGSMKLTENGAIAFDSAGNGSLLDLFSQAGALRPRTDTEITSKFAAAYAEDALLATKLMFYTGDIRQGGLGERRTFRICLKWLANHHPEVVNKNIELIPFYNRFDSWFELIGTPCEKVMWECVAETLMQDVRVSKRKEDGKLVPISLLAKWMPSENASSAKTKRMAMKAMQVLHLTPRRYRKMLSCLRQYIGVVECRMSNGEWGAIDYSKVPSYAMHNYGSAFAKHDYARFNEFLNRVEKGEVKVNASTLFPYDLVHKYMGTYWHSLNKFDPVVEAQWKALPNYIEKDVNAVVMADVSGSMSGRPMETSIGLATYFAQHNTGAYHNKYMTFTSQPSFITLKDEYNLRNCVDTVMRTDVGYSTNLNAAFDAILTNAISYKVSRKEMPQALIVISDMEIDPYFRGYRSWDFVETQRRKFARYGYKLPKLILWNVEARNDTFLSQCQDVILLSGQSASTFKNLCQNLDGVTAYQMMLKILNSKAYDKVKI